MPSVKGSRQHKVNQDAYVRVVKAMMEEPQTLTSLEECTGLHRVTLQRLFRTFRKHGVVHITDWEPDSRGRDTFAVFTLGKGRDKPKFKMTKEQIAKRYRDKQKMKKATAVLDNIIKGAKNAERTDSEACTA